MTKKTIYIIIAVLVVAGGGIGYWWYTNKRGIAAYLPDSISAKEWMDSYRYYLADIPNYPNMDEKAKKFGRTLEYQIFVDAVYLANKKHGTNVPKAAVR